MRHVTANTAQKDFDIIFDDVMRFNEPITIVSDDNKAGVLISMEEWRGMQETIYLQSIPGMIKSIKEAAAEPISEGVDAADVNFDV